MILEKRSWPLAVYDAEDKMFSLCDGRRFTLDFFLDAPTHENKENLYRAGRKEDVPVGVWLACYRESISN